MAEKRAFLYQDVFESLRRAVRGGELAPGEKLLSEDDLAAKYNVSKITVKKALEMLKSEGYIDRVQGRGTFVRAALPGDEAAAPAKRKRLIGMVLEHVATPFGLDMLYETDRLLSEAGCRLIFRFSYGSAQREMEEIEALLHLGVDALITMPCHDSYYSLTILKLILDRFPVVLVDKRMHGLPVASVCTDGAKAVCDLVHHLSEKGLSDAAVLTIDPSSTTSLSDRVNGFYQGLRETGMRCSGECVLPRRTQDFLTDVREEEYLKIILSFLSESNPLPSGIVATEFALGRLLYLAAQRLNLRPGKDFLACCIDEDYQAPAGFVFTHMKQDEKSIAAAVADTLLRLMRGEDVPQTAVKVPAIFMQGKTT